MCLGDKLICVNRKDYFRCALMPNCSVRLFKCGALAGRFVWTGAWIRIDTFDDCESCLSHERHDADRTQQPRCVINEKKECSEAKNPKASGDKQNELKDSILYPVNCAYREQERENEKSGRVPDDVVSQQYCCNDSRSQLPACHLESDKQRPKRKDHETQRCRYQRVEHRLRT